MDTDTATAMGVAFVAGILVSCLQFVAFRIGETNHRCQNSRVVVLVPAATQNPLHHCLQPSVLGIPSVPHVQHDHPQSRIAPMTEPIGRSDDVVSLDDDAQPT